MSTTTLILSQAYSSADIPTNAQQQYSKGLEHFVPRSRINALWAKNLVHICAQVGYTPAALDLPVEVMKQIASLLHPKP